MANQSLTRADVPEPGFEPASTVERVSRFGGFESTQLRSAGLIGILLLVWIFFQIGTDGIFLTPRNLTNLSVQVSITAMLAAGMVLVLVQAEIDLSIGAAVAFCGVLAADFSQSMSAPAAILLTVAIGCCLGAWHGVWIAWLGVPSFIVTLASLLAIRGVAFLITDATPVLPDENLLWVANDSIPALGTGLIFLVLTAGFVVLRMRERAARRAAGMPETLAGVVLLPALPVAAVGVGAVVVTAVYRGLPIPVLTLLATAVAASFLLGQTSFGRHLLATGGNRVAARLAGIRIRRDTFTVFVLMGALYAFAGVILTTRVHSATADAAGGLELQVIAAAVIGGTSLLGGSGTVWGAVLGALLIGSLTNGMGLLDLPSYYQDIVVGVVLLVAVYVDIRARSARGAP